MGRKAVAALSGVEFTTRTLRALAYEYLRYETGAYLVAFERSPLGGKPDVIGLDKRRMLHEVEIKISKQDFNHDAKKPHRAKLMQNLERAYPRVPSTLSYLVPAKLVNHVLENAPPYAGVLTPNSVKLNSYTGMPTLTVLRKPTRLHDQRLSIRNCILMMRDLSGSMASLLRDDVRMHTNKKKLETQIIELGGVVEKPKRKKRTKTEIKKIQKLNKKQVKLKAKAQAEDEDTDAPKPKKRKTVKKASWKKSKFKKTTKKKTSAAKRK